jgi:hypothetical protein
VFMVGFHIMFSLQASPEDKGPASTLSRPKFYSWVPIVPRRPCAIVGTGCANTVPRKEPCSFLTLNLLLHEGLGKHNNGNMRSTENVRQELDCTSEQVFHIWEIQDSNINL